MKNKKTLFILALVFVLLIGGASILYRHLGQSLTPKQFTAQKPSQTQEKGKDDSKTQAPDFIVYDAEGNEVRLSDFFGKPIVLNFWASWCGPCQMEMPEFHEKYLELGDNVHFLMVNTTDGLRETVDTASAFIAENAYTFPVLYDTFHEKYLELGDNVHFLMVNTTDGLRETVDTASAFIAENAYTFPVLYDTKSDAASAYSAYSLPTTFFIDAEGYAIAQAVGAIDMKTLQRGIDLITEEPQNN